MYRSGNIGVRNWVDLCESPCIYSNCDDDDDDDDDDGDDNDDFGELMKGNPMEKETVYCVSVEW